MVCMGWGGYKYRDVSTPQSPPPQSTNQHKQGTNLQLPLPLAQALLNPLDASSLTAANTPEAKARVGLLLWAGPVVGKAPLLTHFQVCMCTIWLGACSKEWVDRVEVVVRVRER